MKWLVFFLVIGTVSFVYAQETLPEYQFASDGWEITGDRLYQNDAENQFGKVNFRVPQSGDMIYEFNVRYEGGVEDGHGGFGLHLFGDRVYRGRSWGSGNSYLVWFNYDENPRDRRIPAGFSMQLYRSYSHSYMELVESVDLNEYAESRLTGELLSNPVPVKLVVFGDTGEIRLYDPIEGDIYYAFQVDPKMLQPKGDWVTLRTNGIKLSFGF